MRLRRRKSVSSDHHQALPYFIAGDENRLISLVGRGEVDPFQVGNPILLLGESGCGKTVVALHLAARIASKSGTNREATKVVFYSAIDFARLYAEAIAARDLEPLSDELNDAHVLIIDDLHTIADKQSAQEELALRIESRFERGLPTLLTCRRMPSEIRGISERLASRAVPGLTIPLQFPGPEARIVLLQELANRHGLEMGPDLIAILDAGLETSVSVRVFDAAMKQMSLFCRMHECEVGIQAVQSAIQGAHRKQDISLSSITNSVARHFRLRSADLRSNSRKQALVRARSLAMWLARRLTSMSMNQIGDHFGGRDHSTVLHAVRKTSELIESDAMLRQAADELSQKLASA